MKNLRFLTLAMLLASLQSIYCSQVVSEYDDLEKYNVDIQKEVINLEPGQVKPADTLQPVILEDKVVNDYFTSNKVRTLITQETKNGETYRTTTTWTTKNPTIFTWKNAALAGGAAVAIGAGLAYANGAYNLDDINNTFGYASDTAQNISAKLAEKWNNAKENISNYWNSTSDYEEYYIPTNNYNVEDYINERSKNFLGDKRYALTSDKDKNDLKAFIEYIDNDADHNLFHSKQLPHFTNKAGFSAAAKEHNELVQNSAKKYIEENPDASIIKDLYEKPFGSNEASN